MTHQSIQPSNNVFIIPQLVDISYIVQISGFTKVHIYNEINLGRLVKPIKFGRRSRWKAEDVANWINSYIEHQGAN